MLPLSGCYRYQYPRRRVKYLLFFSAFLLSVIIWLALGLTEKQIFYITLLQSTTARPENNDTDNYPTSIRQFDPKMITETRFPLATDPECTHFFISLFQSKTFEPVALASYPGSGNTWLRHLIEYATGIFTGSIYHDPLLLGKGFLGEREPWDAGTTIVQKTHADYTAHFHFSKAILLIREPYPAMISFLNFVESGHVGHGQLWNYGTNWSNITLGQMFRWMTLVKSWLESPAQIHVVHYESLVENPRLELTRICAFLSLDCTRMDYPCFSKNIQGHFKRKKIPSSDMSPSLSPGTLARMADGIYYINDLLTARGYESLPMHLYKFRDFSTKSRSQATKMDAFAMSPDYENMA